MEPLLRMELRIEGRVQGVGFRWSTVGRARELDLAGWVRNEPDGSVLCRVAGPAAAVESFAAWCEGGPPTARVRRVVRRELPEGDGFPCPFELRR
jgi:acylphosphatase